MSSNSEGIELITVTIAEAETLPLDCLVSRVREGYLAIAKMVTERGLHPVRFWNFIPRIGDKLVGGLNRYMVFNRGRHSACVTWFGAAALGHRLATASAVGYIGADLIIHCLATSAAGVPVENPRQIPAWRYSSPFGPQPPCFARGTIAELAGVSMLLVGGTASIIGETSMHRGDVAQQTVETLRNIRALIATGGGVAFRPFDRFHSVRAYVRRPEDVETVVDNLGPLSDRAEIALADICRPELLVEIEGVVNLGGVAAVSHTTSEPA